MDRDLWANAFPKKEFPTWPCPHCRKGQLVLVDGTFWIDEPAWSQEQHDHDAWEPDWVRNRFYARLQCSVPKCGEIVVVSGDTRIEELAGDDEWVLIETVRPLSLIPAPPIISIPKETPARVADPIEIAFALFWLDPGSSAARIRLSVELLLDDFKIPRSKLDSKGKARRMDLAERIEAFKKIQAAHASTLDALRQVGNVGSHEEEVKRETVLDAFELYEHAIQELYGQKTQKIEAIKKKIITSKGKG